MSRCSSAIHSPGRSGSGEQDHRPVARSELSGERLELAVGLERAHLSARRLRVIDAGLCRVAVDEAPLDGSGERLSQGLGGLEAVPRPERHSPRGDLARVELGQRR
jgi:hypothetical protein